MSRKQIIARRGKKYAERLKNMTTFNKEANANIRTRNKLLIESQSMPVVEEGDSSFWVSGSRVYGTISIKL